MKVLSRNMVLTATEHKLKFWPYVFLIRGCRNSDFRVECIILAELLYIRWSGSAPRMEPELRQHIRSNNKVTCFTNPLALISWEDLVRLLCIWLGKLKCNSTEPHWRFRRLCRDVVIEMHILRQQGSNLTKEIK